jgi:hypothetical protein
VSVVLTNDILKLIMGYLGNMKVITSIYLYCRPDLRDEWLIAVDVDNDLEDALVSLLKLGKLWMLLNYRIATRARLTITCSIFCE